MGDRHGAFLGRVAKIYELAEEMGELHLLFLVVLSKGLYEPPHIYDLLADGLLSQLFFVLWCLLARDGELMLLCKIIRPEGGEPRPKLALVVAVDLQDFEHIAKRRIIVDDILVIGLRDLVAVGSLGYLLGDLMLLVVSYLTIVAILPVEGLPRTLRSHFDLGLGVRSLFVDAYSFPEGFYL